MQYIGARYVPIFYQNSQDPTSSLWENNVTYEAMTWVSLANGHMYISKKQVPANIGSPADNGEYWLEAGQYNAYIQQLQDQIDDMNDGDVSGSLQNQINTMNDGDATGSLQNQINTMNDATASGSLQNQIDTMKDATASGSLQNQIDTMKDANVEGSLQYQINDNKGSIMHLVKRCPNNRTRKILFIGDSYARWFVDNQYCFFDYCGMQMGIPYTIAAAAGRGFTNINGAGTFLELLEGVTADRNSYTDIVVCGGCNDYDSIANTLAAITTFCTYAYNNFINAKVWIGMIGGFTNHATSTSQILNKALPAYRACGRCGATYLKNTEYIMFNASCFRSDGTHPTDQSIRRLGLYLADALGNVNDVDLEFITNFQPTGVSGSGYNIGTTYLPGAYTFMHNNRIGFGTSGYQYCSVLITNQSQCISNGIFEGEILDGFTFYGWPTNWTSGLYAAPVQVKVQLASSVVTKIGIVYAKSNGRLALSCHGLYESGITKLDIIPMGYCDTEFDLTR